jgi:glycosyltransferase involved in cell wall biosynthesis
VITDAIIPALDEEHALPGVLDELRGRVRRVIVADNGSRDRTAEVARAGGALVVSEPRRGYGAACLAAIAAARRDPPEVVVFLDADGASDPSELPSLVAPIAEGRAELVLGSRVHLERGSLTPPQRAGNLVATMLIRALYGARHADLGPFRAITFTDLLRLDMRDRDFGWTAEMQVKALRRGLRVIEVPTSWRRRRAGQSKVSGTLRGVVGAGYKILTTVVRHAI